MQKIDITKLGRRWNRLQLRLMFLLILSIDSIVGTFITIDTNTYQIVLNKIEYFSIFAFFTSVYVAYTTFKYGATLSAHAFSRLRLMLLVLNLLCLSLLILSAFVLTYVASQNSPDQTTANFAILSMAGCSVGLIYLSWNLWIIRQINKTQIPNLSQNFMDLMNFAQFNKQQQAQSAWLIRLDQPAGIIWFILGSMIFVTGVLGGNLLIDLWAGGRLKGQGIQQAQQLSLALEALGVWCILKGRTYFVPKAEAVLAIDTRQPILYLRSFLDEKPDYYSTKSSIDRSTEMKTQKYFSPFGPLVAIGSKQDAQPKLGAIRLLRSDDDWQSEVKGLMERSSNIVAAVGLTDWIKWELQEITQRGHTEKTFFLFPVTNLKRWRPLKRLRQQQEERLNVFKEIIGLDIAPILENKEFILVCYKSKNGTHVVTTKKPSSNTQVMALAVAHGIFRLEQERSV
jgi:hypothetical protein